jgi:hypothetical protein
MISPRRFTRLTTRLALVSSIALIGGCASPLEKALDYEEALHERSEERMAQRQKEQQSVIKTLPPWVIKKPTPDSTGVYGSGIGTSHTLSLALQKSSLDARRDLAQEIQQELSAEATMAGARDHEFQSIANTFTARVNVAGAQDVERLITTGRDGYQVYTLLKLNYPAFNTVLTEFAQAGDPRASTMQEQYDQLMRRVNEVAPYVRIPGHRDRPFRSIVTDHSEPT